MIGFIAFTKKEFLEQLRTYKLLIMGSVFFLFGMMSPLLAKLLPDIMSGMTVEGMTFIIPEPTVIDAYIQFFKNLTQMGIIVILLVFGGTLSNELTRGTLINILAKGLPRHTVILSKYTGALTLWTLSYLLAAVTNYGYAVYLFEDASVQNLLFSLFCLWLFGAFVLSLIFLSSTIIGGNFGGLVMTAAVLSSLLAINVFPKAQKFNPIYLSSHNVELLQGTIRPDTFTKSLCITIALILGCMFASIKVFAKKKL